MELFIIIGNFPGFTQLPTCNCLRDEFFVYDERLRDLSGIFSIHLTGFHVLKRGGGASFSTGHKTQVLEYVHHDKNIKNNLYLVKPSFKNVCVFEATVFCECAPGDAQSTHDFEKKVSVCFR